MMAFPWEAAMQLALGTYRLAPEAFWQLTPRELRMMAEASATIGLAAPDRSRLETLLATFPDGEPK